MVVTDNIRYLYNRVEVASKLYDKAKNKDERMALLNYMNNLYESIGAVSNYPVDFEKRKLFKDHNNRKILIKNFDLYSNKMLDNYILNKNYHRFILEGAMDNVEELLFVDDYVEVENNMRTTLSESEFYSVFYEFMQSLKLEELFNKYCSNKKIFSTHNRGDNCFGFTVYNPINKDSDVFITDFNYDIKTFVTLAHEFGHVYDLDNFFGNAGEYNKYFYQSFYQEVISRLFERLSLDYLMKNNVLVNDTKEELFSFLFTNYDFLFQSYIYTLLDDVYLDSINGVSREILYDQIKDYFNEKEVIKDYIFDKSIVFDLLEDNNYAYGDIISLYLKNVVLKEGLSSDEMNYYFNMRGNMFDTNYFDRIGYTEKVFQDYYNDEVKLLKK